MQNVSALNKIIISRNKNAYIKISRTQHVKISSDEILTLQYCAL
jgi:hypothetical protein